MKNIHFKTCTCLLGILLILFSGIQVKGASLEVQQESKVSGTVTDEKGEPVIGASVVVVESKQGTITDIDGKFLVNVPKNGHLKVSYIGYETQEVAVKNRQLLKIVLKEESTALNEVVVVGYGTASMPPCFCRGKFPAFRFLTQLWPIRTIKEVFRFVVSLPVMQV